MNQDVLKEWVTALRSGHYEQGRERLRTSGAMTDRFCCLGVLCDLYTKDHPHARWVREMFIADSLKESETYETHLPPLVMKWAGLGCMDPTPPAHGKALSVLNDGGSSFEDIADIIEKSWSTK